MARLRHSLLDWLVIRSLTKQNIRRGGFPKQFSR